MNPARLASDAPGAFSLHGELSFDSVPTLWRRSAELWRVEATVTVDLAGVARADSAGLALLADWARQARARGLTLTYHDMPEQMRDLARVSGLDRVLPQDQ